MNVISVLFLIFVDRGDGVKSQTVPSNMFKMFLIDDYYCSL